MSATGQQPTEVTSGSRVRELQAKLRRLERRDLWMWWAATTVMLLLTVAVISLSFPEMLKEADLSFQFNLTQAVRGLVGLVLLFNTYTIYQQLLIRRLRRHLAEQLQRMARLERRAEEFQKLAILDPLTGLYNRRVAEERLAAEVSRSQRHGHPLTVVVLDLDKFKEINDRHGHAAGDQVLKVFAERLKKAVRASDLPVRQGGDEFLVVLVECIPERAPLLLERLGPIEVEFRGRKLQVSFSAGWAGYQLGETAEQLVERADRALYENKRAGKVVEV